MHFCQILFHLWNLLAWRSGTDFTMVWLLVNILGSLQNYKQSVQWCHEIIIPVMKQKKLKLHHYITVSKKCLSVILNYVMFYIFEWNNLRLFYKSFGFLILTFWKIIIYHNHHYLLSWSVNLSCLFFSYL